MAAEMTMGINALLISIGQKTSKKANTESTVLENAGIIALKRRLLGLCGTETTKTTHELAEIIRELSGAGYDQALKCVFSISDKELEYCGIIGLYVLKFTPIENNTAYKIERIKYDLEEM